MVDVMAAEKRSALMSRIRGKNTGPELEVRQMLWQAGLRYRLHVRELPGRPDIVLPKWRAVVFVHGCFWHMHEGCPLFRLPATRTAFWLEKLESNRSRDQTAIQALASAQWRVTVVWECALNRDRVLAGKHLVRWIRSDAQSMQLLAAQPPKNVLASAF